MRANLIGGIPTTRGPNRTVLPTAQARLGTLQGPPPSTARTSLLRGAVLTGSTRPPVVSGTVTNIIGQRPATQSLLVNRSAPLPAPPILPPVNLKANPTTSAAERNRTVEETVQRENALPELVVTAATLSTFSYADMQKIAVAKVTHADMEGHGSINDPRMGSIVPTSPCDYCSLYDCPGHYGIIEFGNAGRIYNPAFIREIVAVLTCVCNSCGKLLISQNIYMEKGFNKMRFGKRLAALEDYCKTLTACTNNNKNEFLPGGPIAPCSRNPLYETKDLKENGKIMYRSYDVYSDKKSAKASPIEPMGLDDVAKILDKISVEDAKKLGYTPPSHPRNLIMQAILVPPINARVPTPDNGMMVYDQITKEYSTIIKKVLAINAVKDQTGRESAVHSLYTEVKELIFRTEGKKLGPMEFESIIQRIQGKSAILRKCIMGKRNDFCGRTVAGPDPTLKFGEIRLPAAWRDQLFAKERVTDFNRAYIIELMKQGEVKRVVSARTNMTSAYQESDQEKIRVGDWVYRRMRAGDRTACNRQPTLHRQSMMAYKIVLGEQLSIGFHMSYTSPLNLDFDGDETNIWFPQDFEVIAEAEYIMNVRQNIMSSEQNRPIMGMVMNSVTGAYLLTDDGVLVDDKLILYLQEMLHNRDSLPTLGERLERYGIHPRSGKAVFSMLLPPDFYYNHSGVLIMEGVLVQSRIRKSHIGASQRSIIQELWKKYGMERTCDFFTDAPWVIGKWLLERGLSVGISSVVNYVVDPTTGQEIDKNKKILDQELSKIYVQIDALGPVPEDPLEKEYHEQRTSNLVDIAEGIGLRLAREALDKNNPIGVQTDQGAGTKGSTANIGKIMGSVGQQHFRGSRLMPNITGNSRRLPNFDPYDTNPIAWGFIPESYYTGMTPVGLWSSHEAGREGILDTALGTADSGTIQHRMIKAFENVIVARDGSTRNIKDTLFSPCYNSGYDIGQMIKLGDGVHFIDLKREMEALNISRGWIPTEQALEITKRKQELNNLSANDPLFPRGPAPTPLPPIDTSFLADLNGYLDPSLFPNPKRLNLFEKARLIGTRAMQLSNNAKPLLDPIATGTIDPFELAVKEYEQGLLGKEVGGLYVVRRYPNGPYEKVYPTLENI